MMKSIIAHCDLGIEFVISVESVDNKHVNIFINGITESKESKFPVFYKEHTKFNVKFDFDDIFNVIKYGIEYHHRWKNESKMEIREWIMNHIEDGFF